MSDTSVIQDDNSDGDFRDDTDRDPVEALASEFAERFRNGENVTIEEYASRHPALAEDIRELFPTIEAMERLNTKRVRDAAMLDRSKPRQLGDYRIVNEIARGGMGVVYEAEQLSLARRVAVKVLPSHCLTRDKDIRRFQREAQTAASLHHSNIVPVFGVGEENGQHYIVMQLIRGVGLDEILREVKRVFVADAPREQATTSANRLSQIVRSAANLVESDLGVCSTEIDAHADTVEMPITKMVKAPRPKRTSLRATLGHDYYRNVAEIGLQAAEAIQYAHEHNTLHRDIKPGNLILDENGRVWIADFGLAKAVQDNELTGTGDLVGTIAYAAPERFQGSTSTASDLYSLGVTLHEMLTLQKAFTGADRVEVLNQVTNHGLIRPRKLNPAVPSDLETIVMKAAANRPGDRYASAQALAEDLTAFLADRPIAARRISYLEHGLRWCGRNKLLASLACSVLLLVATVIGLLAADYQNALENRAIAERSADRAMGVVEDIYNHFAPPSLLSTPIEEDFENDLGEASDMEPTPISRSTAVLLENLLDYYDELAADSADSKATLKTVSANRRVGDIHRRLDQLDDARFSYNQAIKRIEQLPETLRNTEPMRLEAARIYNGLGLAAGWRGTRDRIEAHRNAANVLDGTSESPDEQFELATSLYLLAFAKTGSLSRQHRRDRDKNEREALGHLNDAKSILTTLTEISSNAERDLLLARCLLREGEVTGGKESKDQGVKILNRLVEQHPDNPDFQHELAEAYVDDSHYGNVKDEAELPGQENNLRHALMLTANLEVEHPNIPAYYRVKKNLNESLAKVLRRLGNLPEAEKHYERAVQLQRLLIAHAGTPEIHKFWLYRVQRDFGSLLMDVGKLERAKDMLLESTVVLDELVQQSGEGSSRSRRRRDDSKHRLAATYRMLAKIEEKLGNEDGSAQWLKKAEQLFD